MHIFAKGFTFGSVVNHQLVGLSWSRPNEILVIISWTLILLNFLVYCFPDSAPTYQDLKGELLFQRSPTRKPADGWLLRRVSWFSEKSRAVFRGQVLAVYLIQIVSKFEFKADLFLDSLPPKSVPATCMSIHELSGSPLQSKG